MGRRHGALVVLVTLVATTLPASARATAGAVVDQLYLDSAPGDQLDHGRIRSIRSPDEGTIVGGPSDYDPTPGAGAQFVISPTDTTEDGTNWSLGFEAAPNDLLAPGHYDATDDPFRTAGKAYFKISGNSSACTSTAASFDILEASFRGDGTPTSFAARFEQWCGTGPMRGEIRFHSSVPLVARDITPSSLSFPTTDVGSTSDPLTFMINNTGTADLVIAAGTSISPQFRATNDGCSGTTVAASASCTLEIVFEPDVGGPTIGSATFADNSIGATRSLRIDGAGIATTTTTVTSSVNPNIYPTTPAILTATVDPVPDGGSVSFYVDGHVTATKALTNGTATLTYNAATGSHSIVAKFLGLPYWRASDSEQLTQESMFIPDITLWASPVAAPDLHPVAVGAQLRPAAGLDGGTLTLVDETAGKTIGTTGPLGVIFDCLSRPDVGVHHLKATFSGYGDALPAVATLDVTVGSTDVVYGPAMPLDVSTGSVWCADLHDADASANVASASLVLTAQAIGPLRFTDVRLSNSDETDANGVLTKARTVAYDTPISWSLVDPAIGGEDADGQVLVWYQLKDSAGAWTPLLLAPFWLDREPPIGAVTIDGGATTTATTTATLSVPAADATTSVSAVALSNDGVTWTTRPYSSTQPWTLPTTNGTRTVYGRWRDAAGNWSAVKSDTIVLDTTAPTGSISVNAGAAYAQSTAVTLSVRASDAGSGVSQVALSNDGTAWSTRTYAPSQSWTLPSTNGIRTVYAKWKDGAGNWSAVKSDTIVLDTAAPTGSVTVNTGAAYAQSTAVTLSVGASDAGSGVSQVALSNDGVTWTTRTYAASQAWTLPATNGTRTVYAKWKDNAGNWSAPKSDTIVLDTVAPTASAPTNAFAAGSIVNSGLTPTKLTWTGADVTSGVAGYELARSTDGGAWATISSTLTAASTTRNLAKSHTYRFRVRAVDKAGNVGAWAYGATFEVSAYQESSASIHYHGTWHTGSTTAYWGDHDRYTTSPGAYATFTFTGRSFAWVNATSVSRGSAKVYVNGTYVATVDLHASSATYRKLVFAKSWTTSATRTITIKCVGTAGHPRIDIDALVIGT